MSLTGTKRIGRPPKSPQDRAGAQIQFRIRGGYRERLVQAAAANGRSISEEAEFRLNRSFDLDDIRAAVREELERQREGSFDALLSLKAATSPSDFFWPKG